jgi:hypothetical protein
VESGPRSCGGDGGLEGAGVVEVGPSWPSIRGGRRAKAIQEENRKSFTPAFSSPASLVNYLGPFYTEMMMELTKTNSSFRFVNKLENIEAFKKIKLIN